MANRFHAVHIVQQQLALQEYYSNVEMLKQHFEFISDIALHWH